MRHRLHGRPKSVHIEAGREGADSDMKRRGSPACLSLTMREGGSTLPSSGAEPRAMTPEEEMFESERVWRR
uniref:Uncharacterized protein n=1 Tax=Oryza sativa subsp. japonica TaxID=39947 RepID=Q69TY7_ORYSJ|nr:hypothetical protein [Oryza sativa Japonica Group]BAD37735.1 hypothetical protein [Oryza sativa Japonica Group]